MTNEPDAPLPDHGDRAIPRGDPHHDMPLAMRAALQWLLDDMHDSNETHDERGKIFDSVEYAAQTLIAAGGGLAWYPPPPPQPVRVLGHDFLPMDEKDWQAYAGAEPGTLICHATDCLVLLWHPETEILSEMVYHDSEKGISQWDWSREKIV